MVIGKKQQSSLLVGGTGYVFIFEVAECPCVYLSSDVVTERPCVMTVYVLRPTVYVLGRTSQPRAARALFHSLFAGIFVSR